MKVLGVQPVWIAPADSDTVAGPRSLRDVRHADVAQLVAHHLAKVRVAGSNPVVRSEEVQAVTWVASAVGWPRGEATACKAVYTGSNPVPTSQEGCFSWSAMER